MIRSVLLQLNRNRLYLIILFVFLCVLIFDSWHTARMQAKPLNLANIMNGLQAEEISLADRNKILTKGVKERRVTFVLTQEIEKELKDLGASSELIEVIRQNGPKPIATPIPTPTPPDFNFYRTRGNDFADKGEYDRAISDYSEAIRLNPQDAVSFYSRGIAYQYKNNSDRAFEDYNTAARLSPDLALQPTLQCVSYDPAKTGNPDKAIEECGKIISQSSDFALAYFIRGNAYNDKKDFDRAIADYNKFIELKPQDSRVYIRRGDAFLEKKDYERAIADYNKAIELDANNEPAKKNLQRAQTEQANAAKTAVTPSSTEKNNAPQILSVGSLNGRAIKLNTPFYPPDARKMGLQGKVEVQLTLDENGNVLSAKAISGNGIFYAAAEDAARRSKFQPVLVDNKPVKALGFIIYNFVR